MDEEGEGERPGIEIRLALYNICEFVWTVLPLPQRSGPDFTFSFLSSLFPPSSPLLWFLCYAFPALVSV